MILPSEKTQFKKNRVPWNKGKILVPLDEQRKKINKRARERYAKNPEKVNKKKRANYRINPEKEIARGKRYRATHGPEMKQRILDLTIEVYSHYSKVISNSDVPVCACIGCGVKHIEFLTLDHMFGRKSMGSVFDTTGDKLWRRLKRDSYPVGMQVLCWNCNSAKSNNPFCPVHEWFKYNQK